MNKFDSDELDSFLWEVETVSKQVKDIMEGKVDVQKLIEKEKMIKERKEKEEHRKKMKKEEEKRIREEKIRNGNKGKGEGTNYEMFCIGCFVEYETKEIVKCSHCNKDLMTRDQRHADLKNKVEILKEQNTKKKFRRMKYENWMKTEGILKVSKDKIGPTNYQKWDFYESESDPDEASEPILPKHDPNFIALEKQLKDDEKVREASRKKALNLKDQGNEMLSHGKYKKAVELYTEAMDNCKSMMVLYTNRALAYIKLEKYKESITDCDRVIEYLDVFEEELKANKEIYIKAQSRKALSCLKIKMYQEAKTSIDKALELKQDEELLKLRANIHKEEEIHLRTLEEIKGDTSDFEIIDCFLREYRQLIIEEGDSDQAKLVSLKTSTDNLIKILNKGDNYKFYLIQQGGLEVVINKLPHTLEIIPLFNRDERFIIILNNLKGYNKLIKLFFNEKITLNVEQIKLIISILEASSQNEEVRKNISAVKKMDEMFCAALYKYNLEYVSKDIKSMQILSHLLTFICNLCYSSPNVRSIIVLKNKEILSFVQTFCKVFDFSQQSHIDLAESLFSFLTNLANDIKFRRSLFKQRELTDFVINEILSKVTSNKRTLKQNEDLLEKGLSLLYNVSFGSETDNETKEMIDYYIASGMNHSLDSVIMNLNSPENKLNPVTILRVFMIINRVMKFNPKSFNQEIYPKLASYCSLETLKLHQSILDNSIKILAHLARSEEDIRSYLNIEDLMGNLSIIFLNDYPKLGTSTERIINTMSLMISIVGKYPNSGEILKECVPCLIAIAKDKTDLLRKNAAILLAKLIKSSDKMDAHIRSLHGMDVLLNVAKFIKL